MIINGKEMVEFTGTRVKIVATTACNTHCKHCCFNVSGKRSQEELRR